MAVFILDKDQMREHVPTVYVNANSQMPPMDEPQRAFLLPILGKPLMEELLTAMAGSPSALQAQAIGLCRAVLAPFAYLRHLPFMQGLLADHGLTVQLSQETRPVFKWEYKIIEESLQRRGYAAQEELIVFLSEHAASFPLWASAPFNAAGSFAIVRCGKDLEAVVNVEPSRSFLLLRPLLYQVAEMVIRPSLGQDYYAALNTAIIAGNTSTHDDTILPMLRMATGNLAIGLAAGRLALRLNGSGFTVAENLDNEADNGRKAASVNQVATAAQEYTRTGESMMSKVLNILNTTASESAFPEFFNSPQYVKPDAAIGTLMGDNAGRAGSFAF